MRGFQAWKWTEDGPKLIFKPRKFFDFYTLVRLYKLIYLKGTGSGMPGNFYAKEAIGNIFGK
jgi:hypothetical protein